MNNNTIQNYIIREQRILITRLEAFKRFSDDPELDKIITRECDRLYREINNRTFEMNNPE